MSRSPRSASSNALDDLLYWSGNEQPAPNDFDEESLEREVVDVDIKPIVADEGKGKERDSMYVHLFEHITSTVLKYEAHLFAPKEIDCIVKYTELDYSCRYLLVRLALRKADRWHRLSALKYYSELGESIPEAINVLCHDPSKVDPMVQQKSQENPSIIDLTLDEDDEPEPTEVPKEPLDLLVFAEDESQMTLHELLDCLTTDELKVVAKDRKIKTIQNRPSLVSALLTSSTTQSTLNFPILAPSTSKMETQSNPKTKSYHQTCLPFAPKVKSADKLRASIVKILGKCIRVNSPVLALFRRINLVYFRSTAPSPQILTPALLTRAKKRFYPTYIYQRTNDIWKTREDLLAYEDALEMEAKIGGYLDGMGGGRSKTPNTPAPGKFQTPALTPGTVQTPKGTTRVEDKGDRDVDIGFNEDRPDPEPARIQDARLAKAIFMQMYEPWKELIGRADCEKGHYVKCDELGPVIKEAECASGLSGSQIKAKEHSGEEHRRRRGLKRFERGHVWTRIVQKGASALGILKEYDAELEVLDSLLNQRRWRCGKRGAWYDRKACILMTHCGKNKVTMEKAMEAVIEGLKDDDTHIIYRPKLERRLTILEKRLRIPLDERHNSEGNLAKPVEVHVEGIRVKNKAASVLLDSARRSYGSNKTTPVKNGGMDIRAFGLMNMPIPANGKVKATSTQLKGKEEEKKGSPWEWKGKSVWVGKDGEEVNVEMLALQHYESFGYKGFHSEGRIVCTMFGLLFWDIIFAPVPGALETPYQSAPMDIAEDSFCFARQDLIEARLDEIHAGMAKEILEGVDANHRKNGTWCVGVRWDLFSRQDLLEIADCLGGKSLSVLCRLLCEDYSGRGSGVPDLIVWNAADGECKFVEVKGPGDSLQENQKIWIDVLLRAGTAVELCHVVERGLKKKITKKLKVKKTRSQKTTVMPDSVEALEPIVLSEDEDPPELDASMDVDEARPFQGTKRHADELPVITKRITNRAEVIILVPSPSKRQRMQA